VADVDVVATLRRHGLDDRVDVRRMSAFDLAAGAAPVTWLEEHYRSVPHLIEFSADRFYAGRISVATRHPANDSLDVIEVVRSGAELETVLALVHKLAAARVIGIGVVTPFRAQADALEAALVKAFPVAELERLGLRVGTVHAYQGSEAHTVIASLGLADGDPPSRRRFAADPHLFNVLITRARERMIVVTALSDADGVIGEYLAFSETPPPPPAPADAEHEWTAALATELRRAGRTVRCDYPVGRWRVDLCLGDGTDAIGLTTRVHPDGVAAHIDRQRSLTRVGWRLVDGFASRWGGDPVRAALDLSA
jgi:superfamily I DNA/RNA helicase